MTHNRLATAARRGFWILAASGAALGLAACGDAESADDAVQRAALEISTLSLGGTNPLPDKDLRLTAYRRIVTDLQPHSTGGTPGTAAAANMLVARAHTGLATIQVGELVQAEEKCGALIDLVRIQLDRYITQQVQAMSLGGYDPAPHLADLDSQITAKDAEIAKAWSEKEALTAELDEIEGRAAAASALAKQQRERETALRQQAINASAVEQAELITKANEHKRAADGHDMEASILRAQAAQRAPEGVVFQAEVDRLTDQRKLLEEAKVEIRAFAKSNSDRAAAARADAMAAAELIRQRAGELAALRAEIPEIADKASQSFDAAIRAARASQAAGGSARAQAAVTVASNQHAQANLLAVRARGLMAYATLLTALAEATPALPDAAAYRTQATEAATAAEGFTAEAKTLIEEAATAYENAGSGETSEQFKQLAISLGRPGEAAPQNTETAAADGGEVVAGDPEAEIRQMLVAMKAAGEGDDPSQALAFIHTDSAEFRAMLEAAVEVDAACREKLGGSMDEIMADAAAGMGGGMPGGAPGMDMLGVANAEIEDYQIAVASPTSATISIAGAPAGAMTTVRKIDGAWKLDLQMPPEAAQMLPVITSAFKKIAGDIRSGAITSGDQIMPALMESMMPAIMEQMQQQGGG